MWPGFVWGGGSSWWSGCWASLEPAPRGTMTGVGGWGCGGVMDAVGRESGQGVNPPPAWGQPCPCPCPSRDSHPSLLHSLLPAGPSLQGYFLSFPHWVSGWVRALGTSTELWSRWMRAGRVWAPVGPCDDVGLEGLRAGGAWPYVCRAKAHSLSHPESPSPLHAKGPLAFSLASDTSNRTGQTWPGIGLAPSVSLAFLFPRRGWVSFCLSQLLVPSTGPSTEKKGPSEC